MLDRYKNAAILISIVLAVLTTWLTAGCARRAAELAFIPFLPPEYYDCTEVNPQALVNIYFTGYADFYKTEAMYNDAIYVFKNVMVDERMFLGISDGFIWVDQIKCYLVTPGSMDRFKPGDKIDVVGVNKGPTSYYIAGLTFEDCYVLPAGAIALPVIAGSATFQPVY